MTKKLSPEKLERAAYILKTVAHPVRLAIIEFLSVDSELNCSDLQEKLGIEQSLLSHHVNNMYDKGILQRVKNGKNIYYSLKDKAITNIISCIEKCSSVN